MTTQKIKIWKHSPTVVPLMFIAYTQMCTNVYGDSTKDEKEKSQYQDTICSEAEEGHGDRPWEVLYDYVVHPATSKPSEDRALWGISTHGKKKNSLRLFWSWWLLEYISFSPYGHYSVSYNDLCHLASAVVDQWSNTCAKNSNGRTFWNLNLLRGCCMLLPFHSALTPLCAPGIV